MAFDLSLIVCTRNRASQLRRCLDALGGQDYDPRAWELVVIDNGSTDETPAVISAFARMASHAVRVVQEPQASLGRARNTGVRLASAPLLALTDDDCYAAPDFVRSVVAVFASQAHYGFIGGRVLLHDETDAPDTIRTGTEPEEIPPGSILTPGLLHGANMAVRRSVWAKVGGFDPWFGAGTRFSGDDIDFLCRASRAGVSGAYRPEPTVSHHHGRKPGPAVARRRRSYARGRGAYYTKIMMDPRWRGAVMRQWYWQLRLQLKHRRIEELMTELAGAGEYTLRRTFAPPIATAPLPHEPDTDLV